MRRLLSLLSCLSGWDYVLWQEVHVRDRLLAYLSGHKAVTLVVRPLRRRPQETVMYLLSFLLRIRLNLTNKNPLKILVLVRR